MNRLSLDLVNSTNSARKATPPSSSLTLIHPADPCLTCQDSLTLMVFSLSVFLQSSRDLTAQTCSPRYLEAEAGELQVQGLKMKRKRGLETLPSGLCKAQRFL